MGLGLFCVGESLVFWYFFIIANFELNEEKKNGRVSLKRYEKKSAAEQQEVATLGPNTAVYEE